MSKQLGKHVIVGAGSFLAIAVGVASVQSVQAADIPGNNKTKVVLKRGLTGTVGVFEKKNDSDWYRVALEGGTNYAFDIRLWTGSATCARLNLRDLSGKVLRSVYANGGNDDGFEFRPAKDRTVFAEVKDCSSEGGTSVPTYPSGYRVRVNVDARGDMTTKATLKVGQTINGLFSSVADSDYFRVQLDSRKTYTLSMDGDDPTLNLLDSTGKALYRGDGGRITIAGITVPKSGTYYVAASDSADFSRTYTLSLTSP